MEMKLILEIAEDKKLELTEADAKALYLKLNELFGYKGWSPYWYNSDTVTVSPLANITYTSTSIPEDYIRIRMY